MSIPLESRPVVLGNVRQESIDRSTCEVELPEQAIAGPPGPCPERIDRGRDDEVPGIVLAPDRENELRHGCVVDGGEDRVLPS